MFFLFLSYEPVRDRETDRETDGRVMQGLQRELVKVQANVLEKLIVDFVLVYALSKSTTHGCD